jgi:hypothetical protein
MRRSLLVGTLVSSALTLVIACGGGTTTSSGNGSSTTPDIDTFASQLCALYAPCCADAGLPTDGKQCTALIVALGGSQGTYNASAAGACLNMLKQQGGDFCTSGGANGASCNQVFGGGSGNVPPGGQCMKNGDCAVSGGGTATCMTSTMFVDGGTTETRTCVLEMPGKVGDSPCIASILELPGGVTETTYSFGSGTPPTQGYTCDQKDGVYCDSQSMACQAPSDVGGPCHDNNACKAGAYCDFATSVCKATVPAGSSCSGGVHCDSSSYCESASQTCKATLANGTQCSLSEQCQSQQCVNAKCSGGGSFGLQLICGQ